MKTLHNLKFPVMILMTVGGVWVSAWHSSVSDPRRKYVLPATHSMEKLVAKVRAENAVPGDAAYLERTEVFPE